MMNERRLFVGICIVVCICLTYAIKFDGNNEEHGNAPDEHIVHPIRPNERLIPPSCGVKVKPCDPNAKFRRFDGSCNNLDHPEWGLPNATYSRILPAKYANGKNAPRRANDDSSLPGARRVRTSLFPSPPQNIENTLWNINIMQWGQFMTHDMSLLKSPDFETACCPKKGKLNNIPSKYCFPIHISEDDPTQGAAGIRCMNFTRTVTDTDLGCKKKNLPSEQINTVTPYLDLSNVYGNDDYTASQLRSFSGGKLKVEIRNNKIYPPTEPNKKAFCNCNLPNENTCYATGDSRSNQNPQLTILQIIFVREHNRLASKLAEINPHWNDERLFQEARRINIAQYQHISYYEWLPILFGQSELFNAKIIQYKRFDDGYNPKIPPFVSNEHAHGAWRHFHTQIVGLLRLMSAQRDVLDVSLIGEHINRPGVLETSMEGFTVGLVTQPTGETDKYHDFQMSEKLFTCRNEGYGIDLKATDIQRDRDHGLAYYNDYRRYFGLKVASSFDDFKDLIPAQDVETLKTLYTSHEDVDLSVGGSLEKVDISGPQTGPTYMKIIFEQFLRTKQSDRFWYEFETSGLTLNQLDQIRASSVSRLFCDNANGITEIQFQGFLLPGLNSYSGGLFPCDFQSSVNLWAWKEQGFRNSSSSSQ